MHPSAGDVWCGYFPFLNSSETKHRPMLILGCAIERQLVVAARITTSEPRTVRAGELGIYPGDSFFGDTGLKFASKVCLDAVVQLPLSALDYQLGRLDLRDDRLVERLKRAVMSSPQRETLAAIARSFGQSH
jgi:hypothetical protein